MSNERVVQQGLKQSPLLICLVALLIPGAGHLILKRVVRSLLMGGAVLLMFIIGIALGGHIYGVNNAGTGLLSYVFGFCNVGNGLLYGFSFLSGIGVEDQAVRPTSEYGNVFLMVSGLLNYILAMDAYDIASGRKH